ncbi:MAG: ABC transporter substrate-binding protein [Deltaproteobacteria bacterium]|nr:ABC transporter substrate-binding protein [Deltaproteobacteria bacterium]MBW1934767.1 ABC transporter substrate-binding protein [Deltaproteobacteria bacterium]
MGKKGKKFLSVGVLLMGGLLCLSLLFMPASAQARNIKVGIIDCYSGPAAVYCNEALNGFKLALKEINKQGVLGRKIEFTTRDTKFKVDLALNMAKELVMRENVDVLAGTINSGAALAVSEAVAKAEKIPLLVWISKSERITGEKGHRYVFSTGENTAMAGKAAGVALSRKPYKKYWIAGDDYEYGHAMADAAWRNLKALRPDVKLIGKSWWKPGEPDLVPYFTAIVAAKAEAVILCTGGRSMANALKTIKAMDLTKKVAPWIHTATEIAVLRSLGPGAPEGVLGTSDYLFYYPDTPENRALANAFKSAYGSPPGFPGFHGYITAKFIAEGFRRAGSLNKEKFIDALEGLKIDSPVGGKLEMRACDHQVVLPIYLGVTKKVPQYNFLISADNITLSGDEVMPSCEEIMKARGKK